MQLKVVSWNLNGLLSCVGNNSFAPVRRLNPDVIFLQEIRTHQTPTILDEYTHVYYPAERDGYSGTAVLYKPDIPLVRVIKGFVNEFNDTEGRLITLELNDCYVVGAYVPNSQSNLGRHGYRLEWDNAFQGHIQELLWEKPVIICGDFNLVRGKLDYYEENERENFKQNGYITDEQSGFQSLLELGLSDVFRTLYPTKKSYTWWSNRLNKRAENRGWRLDYFLVSDSLLDGVTRICHHNEIYGSDHCPIELCLEVDSLEHKVENTSNGALEKMWNDMDWQAAEQRLDFLQQQLTFAAFERDYERIKRLQSEIVRDLRIKCLAVRKVCESSSPPGVDRVRWKTGAQKMQAAMSLTSKDYKASPLRQIHLTAKNTGKTRNINLSTYRDRAMSVLYGFSLLPVTEAWSERKSFAFRQGRSPQDAHAYIMDALEKENAPQFMVCVDVKGFYAHIQHEWLMENLPMDKKVLKELLSAGIIFAGELFSSDDMGISEGSSISPYIANFVLDGLQRYIFEGLYGDNYGDRNIDYSNGNLIRFADDILVQARDKDTADFALELVKEFLEKRGLTISLEKTKIRDIAEGFTYLSRTYRKLNGVVSARPSDRAVARFIDDITETISTNRKSQRELINTLNSKLRGWAGYHRCTDAIDAFRKVDVAVQTALLDTARKKHPKLPIAKVVSKYWYTEPSGRHCYALPDDKTVRVIWLEDTMLTAHNKLATSINPYLDKDKMEQKSRDREIQNVTGKYKAVWERQGGRCFYCGKKILQDQPRTVIPLDLSRPPSAYNSSYIHKICELNTLEIIRTDEDITYLRDYDVEKILTEIANGTPTNPTRKGITARWKYYALKLYFQNCKENSLTLTFAQIEKILGFKLPSSARKYYGWWSFTNTQNKISDAWVSEGFVKQMLDLKEEKVYFVREVKRENIEIPAIILNGNLPENAKIEIETFCQYIIEKYGLKNK